jgi:hypothetical protein
MAKSSGTANASKDVGIFLFPTMPRLVLGPTQPDEYLLWVKLPQHKSAKV